MAIKQTEFLKLTMDDPTEAYSVERVNENTRKIDNKLKEHDAGIKSIKLVDKNVNVEAKDKTLDKVLEDLEKEIGKKITAEEAPQPKNYDDEIRKLHAKDDEIVETVKEFKSVVDEYSENLGIYVSRHNTANTKLEALL